VDVWTVTRAADTLPPSSLYCVAQRPPEAHALHLEPTQSTLLHADVHMGLYWPGGTRPMLGRPAIPLGTTKSGADRNPRRGAPSGLLQSWGFTDDRLTLASKPAMHLQCVGSPAPTSRPQVVPLWQLLGGGEAGSEQPVMNTQRFSGTAPAPVL
jgi:hypothetical protein